MARSPNSKSSGFGNVGFGSFTVPFDMAVELDRFFRAHPEMGRGDVMTEALRQYLERMDDMANGATPSVPRTAEDADKLSKAAKAEVARQRRNVG